MKLLIVYVRSLGVVMFVITSFCVAPVASAVTISHVFVGSSSGSESVQIGDTIEFQVWLTVPSGTEVNIGWFSLTGDIDDAETSSVSEGWAGVDNFVVDWAWIYVQGTFGRVKFGTNGSMFPLSTFDAPGPSRRQAHVFGFNNGAIQKVGTGEPALVGTVTIKAETPGVFNAGAYLHPGSDAFFGTNGVDPEVGGSMASFTVVGTPPSNPPIPTTDEYIVWPAEARLGDPPVPG